MEKEKLTEAQIRLFYEYGTIPAGYSKEEVVELIPQNNQIGDERYSQNEPITNKNIYRFCEICNYEIRHSFHPPGQRIPNRYLKPFGTFTVSRLSRGTLRRGSCPKISKGYCHICHKSMCSKCSVGIVCKNCIEFFPDVIKNKSLTLKKWWKIIYYIGIFFPFFAIGLIFFSPPPISDLTYSELALIVLAYLVTLSSIISFYYIFKYFEDTTANFLKDLKDNPQNHESILNEVNSVYYDTFVHPESNSNLKGYFLYSLMNGILGIPILMLAIKLLQF
jgi:hypothetical protein